MHANVANIEEVLMNQMSRKRREHCEGGTREAALK
jgi:hypothetical protein